MEKKINGFSGVMWTKVRFHLREKLDIESVLMLDSQEKMCQEKNICKKQLVKR